jgi:hypothetical protein
VVRKRIGIPSGVFAVGEPNAVSGLRPLLEVRPKGPNGSAKERASRWRNSFCHKFPSAVVRDARVSPACLALLAFRSTFADAKSSYGLWEDVLQANPIVSGRGFGINKRREAIAEAKRLGYLERRHNAKLPRTSNGAFRRAVDRLVLPKEGDGREVWRTWFDGSLTVDEIAALMFVRAGTPRGLRIYARELAARFGWSRPRASANLAALARRGLVLREQQRAKNGTMDGVTYRATREPSRSEAGSEPCNGKPCDGQPRSEKSCRKPTTSSSNVHTNLNEDASAHEKVVLPTRDANLSEQEESSDEWLVQKLESWDYLGSLVPALKTHQGLEPLRQAMTRHGAAVVLDVVHRVLARDLMGEPNNTDQAMRVPKIIRSWKYFRGALQDELRKVQMQANGWRPGDLAGDWREGAIETPF